MHTVKHQPTNNLQHRWKVDLAQTTAFHVSGLMIQFRQDSEGIWDCKTSDANASATIAILTAQHGAEKACARLPELIQEGCTVFIDALTHERLSRPPVE